MNFNSLLFSLENHIATITLNRPERYNAFNNELSFEFIDALKHCKDNEEVRVIVITGAGKAFCSGQDLKDVEPDIGQSVENRYNPIARLLDSIEKPIICRLNGVAAGAGASVAIACDYIVASEKAKLLWAFVNIGLVLDTGSSYLLPKLVGMRKAFELATLGKPHFCSRSDG